MHAGMAGDLPAARRRRTPPHARDLLLTGRVVDADEALRLGLVSRVIDPAPFRDEVLATAEGIAATAPIASRLTKLALADGGHADFESGLQWEAMAQPMTLATEDLQEGDPRRAGEAAAAVHRPVSDPADARRRGPRLDPSDACLPLANVGRTAGGLVCAQT